MDNEKLDLILKANQVIIRDRKWNSEVFDAQSKVIDQNITEILNPKSAPSLRERTHDALVGSDEVKK